MSSSTITSLPSSCSIAISELIAQAHAHLAFAKSGLLHDYARHLAQFEGFMNLVHEG
jgi:hypothetical protein